MPLTLDEVHDVIDSWEFDPRVPTLVPATRLLSTMAVGDPGRIEVLQVIADHQSMRGELDAALATLDEAAREPHADADVLRGTRAAYLIGGGRGEEAEPMLLELRSRGSRMAPEALERVAEALEEAGRLREAMRWFTIGLRDLDPQHDLPNHDERSALMGRWRVRRALELPLDHYDDLEREAREIRRAESATDDWD